MTEPRLATGFWIAAKMRQIQTAGGFASVLVKGHDEAGAINLIWRSRDGNMKRAVPAMALINDSERSFEWRDETLDDAALNELITRELKFDRDQWFVECECSEKQFLEIFNVSSI